jgi:small acid-soluble spore protein N (minor)
MSKSNTKKRNSEHFVPNHMGTQPRGFGGNKGKKMQSNTAGVPQVMQTKGE